MGHAMSSPIELPSYNPNGVQNSESDSEDKSDHEYETDTEINKPRKKHNSNRWEIIAEFANKVEEDAFFTAEPFWKKTTTFNVLVGRKTTFYCSRVNHRKGARCPAEMQILRRYDSTTSSLYFNNQQHVHDAEESVVPKKYACTPYVYETIKKFTVEGKKPREILHLLSLDELVVEKPNKTQVASFFFNNF